MKSFGKKILIPLPRYGFDPTEAAIPWQYLKEAGHHVVFATIDGSLAAADIRMVTGCDLGIFKRILMATSESAMTYRDLEASSEFKKPLPFHQLSCKDFDAILLPGGHDKSMREYLDSQLLQELISEFFDRNKPVGAICHGTLLVGRSISHKTGKSVLWGKKTTGLTKLQEAIAFNLTRLYLGDYYLTYPNITLEDELKSYLQNKSDFIPGPGFPVPMTRDSASNLSPGFVVLDNNYLSARWPGDAHRFAANFVRLL